METFRKTIKVLFVVSGNSNNFEIAPFIKAQGESLKYIGVEIHYYRILESGLGGYIRNGFKLRRFIKINKFDIIHAHYTFCGYAAVIGARNAPIVLSLMGSDAYGEYVGINKISWKSRFNILATFFIQPFVNAIISKSKNIEEFVFRKQISYVIPNGINIVQFKHEPINQRDQLNLSQDNIYILFLGSKLELRKNFILVEAAIRELADPNVCLLNPYPMKHNMVSKYLNAANVLVMSSLAEGSPNVIKEAMACNCPIVSTDVGDVKWVLGNTEGCYVANFDIKDMSNKIASAILFSKEKGRTNGRSRIIELGLDSQSIARRILSLYYNVLK